MCVCVCVCVCDNDVDDVDDDDDDDDDDFSNSDLSQVDISVSALGVEDRLLWSCLSTFEVSPPSFYPNRRQPSLLQSAPLRPLLYSSSYVYDYSDWSTCLGLSGRTDSIAWFLEWVMAYPLRLVSVLVESITGLRVPQGKGLLCFTPWHAVLLEGAPRGIHCLAICARERERISGLNPERIPSPIELVFNGKGPMIGEELCVVTRQGDGGRGLVLSVHPTQRSSVRAPTVQEADKGKGKGPSSPLRPTLPRCEMAYCVATAN